MQLLKVFTFAVVCSTLTVVSADVGDSCGTFADPQELELQCYCDSDGNTCDSSCCIYSTSGGFKDLPDIIKPFAGIGPAMGPFESGSPSPTNYGYVSPKAIGFSDIY
jgi:hypothetical protein